MIEGKLSFVYSLFLPMLSGESIASVKENVHGKGEEMLICPGEILKCNPVYLPYFNHFAVH